MKDNSSILANVCYDRAYNVFEQVIVPPLDLTERERFQLNASASAHIFQF